MPAVRWTISEASASSRLASRASAPRSAAEPISRSGASVARATQSAEPERRPVVRSCAEGHHHRPLTQRAAGLCQQGHVAGRLFEDHARVAVQRRRAGIHEEQIDVLLAGEPDDVLAAPRRGERRGPGYESGGQQPVAAFGKSRSGFSKLRRRDDASDDQLVGGLRGRQRLGEPKERVEPGQRPRHDQERAFRHRCLGRRRLPRRAVRKVERRVLTQDRLLEPPQLLAGLEAELFRELPPSHLVGVEGLGLAS